MTANSSKSGRGRSRIRLTVFVALHNSVASCINGFDLLWPRFMAERDCEDFDRDGRMTVTQTGRVGVRALLSSFRSPHQLAGPEYFGDVPAFAAITSSFVSPKREDVTITGEMRSRIFDRASQILRRDTHPGGMRRWSRYGIQQQHTRSQITR
jgi:hypothetical protein